MKKYIVLAAVVVLAMAISNASAGMWWQRGDPGSTWQDWTFDTGVNPATPEAYSNPGIPQASIVAKPGSHVPEAGWKDGWYGREGVWAGDILQITLDIPNVPPPNTFKEIWLQMEYIGDVTATSIIIPQSGVEFLGGGWDYSTEGWKIYTVGWRIFPNPVEEQIFVEIVNSGAFLNYLYVDTICVPEPATLALLGLGALVLRKRS